MSDVAKSSWVLLPIKHKGTDKSLAICSWVFVKLALSGTVHCTCMLLRTVCHLHCYHICFMTMILLLWMLLQTLVVQSLIWYLHCACTLCMYTPQNHFAYLLSAAFVVIVCLKLLCTLSLTLQHTYSSICHLLLDCPTSTTPSCCVWVSTHPSLQGWCVRVN